MAQSAPTGGGMSRTDYLTGHYWRTNFSSGTGNPGNQLLGASSAFTLSSPGFSGQRLTKNKSAMSLHPLGLVDGVQRTIQVY